MTLCTIDNTVLKMCYNFKPQTLGNWSAAHISVSSKTMTKRKREARNTEGLPCWRLCDTNLFNIVSCQENIDIINCSHVAMKYCKWLECHWLWALVPLSLTSATYNIQQITSIPFTMYVMYVLRKAHYSSNRHPPAYNDVNGLLMGKYTRSSTISFTGYMKWLNFQCTENAKYHSDFCTLKYSN